MRVVGLLFIALTVLLGAPRAVACRVQPQPEEKFWYAPPIQIEPGEVVLEIQYLGRWEEPLPSPDNDRVVIISCGGDGGIFRYRVTRVIRGEFRDAEILLAVGPGGVAGEDRSGNQRHIVVGRLSADHSASGIDIHPPTNGSVPARQATRPLFHVRQPRAEDIYCVAPKPSADATLVLVSTNQTPAISSVRFDSEDQVVHAGRINIEPGDEKLYVVIATTQGMIWQFTGATERVERAVMSSHLSGPGLGQRDKPSLVGAVGLPAEKVAFFAGSHCVPQFSEIPSSASIRAGDAVRSIFGRDPDVRVGEFGLTYNLPSGKVETARYDFQMAPWTPPSLAAEDHASRAFFGGTDLEPYEDFRRYSPGGLMVFDPTEVVSLIPTARYEVLPQEAGLTQLLATGAARLNKSDEYVLLKKTRIPAGLAGAHQVVFVVPRGVPVPDGDPAHSCVFIEDPEAAATFKQLKSCR